MSLVATQLSQLLVHRKTNPTNRRSWKANNVVRIKYLNLIFPFQTKQQGELTMKIIILILICIMYANANFTNNTTHPTKIKTSKITISKPSPQKQKSKNHPPFNLTEKQIETIVLLLEQFLEKFFTFQIYYLILFVIPTTRRFVKFTFIDYIYKRILYIILFISFFTLDYTPQNIVITQAFIRIELSMIPITILYINHYCLNRAFASLE